MEIIFIIEPFVFVLKTINNINLTIGNIFFPSEISLCEEAFTRMVFDLDCHINSRNKLN